MSSWWHNSSDLILVSAALGSCCVGLIMGTCQSMRLSRCRRIKCFCCECDRDVETAEEMKIELEHPPVANNEI